RRRLADRAPRPGGRGARRLARRGDCVAARLRPARREGAPVSRLRMILAGLLFLLGFRRSQRARERIVPEGQHDRRAETLVILLLGASTVCAAGFVAVYALDRIPRQTQFLGLSIGLSFAC